MGYNVWGRQVRTTEEANLRCAKAQDDNPKIENLHIAILEVEHYHWATKETSTKIRYQARWWDPEVARKNEEEARRLQEASLMPHVCNCPDCPHRDEDL